MCLSLYLCSSQFHIEAHISRTKTKFRRTLRGKISEMGKLIIEFDQVEIIEFAGPEKKAFKSSFLFLSFL